jgi:hypothetical protein
MVGPEAFFPQQGGDAPIAVATVLLGQDGHAVHQALLLGRTVLWPSLSGTDLPQHPAYSPL